MKYWESQVMIIGALLTVGGICVYGISSNLNCNLVQDELKEYQKTYPGKSLNELKDICIDHSNNGQSAGLIMVCLGLVAFLVVFMSNLDVVQNKEENINSFNLQLEQKLKDKVKKEDFIRACKEFKTYRKQPVFYCEKEIICLITLSRYANALDRFIKNTENYEVFKNES